MPTNFTVVPVKDGPKKGNEEEGVDDNMLKEVEEDAAGKTLVLKTDSVLILETSSFCSPFLVQVWPIFCDFIRYKFS